MGCDQWLFACFCSESTYLGYAGLEGRDSKLFKCIGHGSHPVGEDKREREEGQQEYITGAQLMLLEKMMSHHMYVCSDTVFPNFLAPT